MWTLRNSVIGREAKWRDISSVDSASFLVPMTVSCQNRCVRQNAITWYWPPGQQLIFSGWRTSNTIGIPMKSTSEAIFLRNTLLLNFEKTVTIENEEKLRRVLYQLPQWMSHIFLFFWVYASLKNITVAMAMLQFFALPKLKSSKIIYSPFIIAIGIKYCRGWRRSHRCWSMRSIVRNEKICASRRLSAHQLRFDAYYPYWRPASSSVWNEK